MLWGLNVAYSLATLCYQVATFAAHPERSVLTIAVVLLFNLILMTCSRLFGREQVLQLPGRMADAPSGQGGCHRWRHSCRSAPPWKTARRVG
ncbi:hypothetical protein P4053_12585 [Pseudomonas aeruginosa]|nr:hypothetical protein [Pseudomonas aeruginosa]